MSSNYRYVGVGDTRTALAAIVQENKVPVDLRGMTATFEAVNAEDSSVVVVAESGTNVAVEPSFSITVTANSGKLAAYGTGLKGGDEPDIVRFEASVMPTGLDEDTFYKVRNVYADGFTVTTCDGTQIITPTTTGTDVECVIVGMVTYAWQDEDVETAQKLRCCFRVVDGSDKSTFPRSTDLVVEVRARP